MKKGDRLSEREVRELVMLAINSIADDGNDLATLHNQLAQGEIEYDAKRGDWVCMRAEGDPPRTAVERSA